MSPQLVLLLEEGVGPMDNAHVLPSERLARGSTELGVTRLLTSPPLKTFAFAKGRGSSPLPLCLCPECVRDGLAW